MAGPNPERFSSRKFIVTMAGMALGSLLTMFGALYEPPEGYWSVLPPLFVFFGLCVGAYNWANLRQAQNGSAPR